MESVDVIVTKGRQKMAKQNNEEWFLTPREFADIVVSSIEEGVGMKSDQRYHPEDILAAFNSAAAGAAMSASHFAHNRSKKKGMMESKDLRKF